MRQVVLALVAAALVLAGCLGSPSQPGTSATATMTTAPGSITALRPLAEATHVSTAGRRVAEFMVAQDPADANHLVTAFGDYDSPGGMLNCAFAASFDGGATWSVSSPVPGFSGPYLQFDGWVGFDRDGGVDAVCLRESGPGTTTETWPYYFRSLDGGRTWSEAQHVPTDPATLSTDKTVLGVGRDGTVFAAVSNLVGTTQDYGKTWVTMKAVERGFAVFNGMAQTADGAMTLLGLGSGDDIWLERTADHGATWNHTVVGKDLVQPGYNDQNRWVQQSPWTTVPVLYHDGASDDLWVAWQSWEANPGAYQVHLARSTDQGRTFAETAVPAFKDAACSEPCHVTHPTIAVDGQGRVAMLAQLTKDGGVLKVVEAAASSDHGATWSPPFTLSKADGMDSWQNPNAFSPDPGNGPSIAAGLAADPETVHEVAAGVALTTAVSELQMRWNGEYWGMAATPKGFVAMWIDHTGGGRPQLWSRLMAVD
jgi:hypothetical protein